MKLKVLLLLGLLCFLPAVFAADFSSAQKSYKSNYDNEEGFAGPGSTVRQLEEDVDTVLGDQTTLEIFYRLQFARNLAITPSIQILGDPALNPDEDEITVLGLRLRLTL